MQSENEKFKVIFKKRVYLFILSLIKFIDSLPKGKSLEIISNQLIRSGTSIGANFVEAQASNTRKDFINFLSYSLKSANESKFWLALIRDTNERGKKQSEILLNELNEISKILGSCIITLKNKRTLNF